MGTKSADKQMLTRKMSRAISDMSDSNQSSVVITNSYETISQVANKADRYINGESTDSDDLDTDGVFSASEDEHENTMIDVEELKRQEEL